MNAKLQLVLRKDGTVAWLSEPAVEDLKKVFTTTTQRWSEITPTNPFLFVAFRILRALFGENGRVAAWTRTWPCNWRMHVLSTGYTETSHDRSYLIMREHELFYYPLGEL